MPAPCHGMSWRVMTCHITAVKAKRQVKPRFTFKTHSFDSIDSMIRSVCLSLASVGSSLLGSTRLELLPPPPAPPAPLLFPLSQQTRACAVSSFHVMFVSCGVVSCRAVSCPVSAVRLLAFKSSPALPCVFSSCRVLSCLVFSLLVLSCLVLSSLILSGLVFFYCTDGCSETPPKQPRRRKGQKGPGRLPWPRRRHNGECGMRSEKTRDCLRSRSRMSRQRRVAGLGPGLGVTTTKNASQETLGPCAKRTLQR